MSFLSKFEKLDLPMHGVRLPEVKINPEDLKVVGMPINTSHIDFLKKMAEKGFNKRLRDGKIPRDKIDEYKARVYRELKDFEEMGFIDYVLMVFDVTNFCDKVGIQRGYGRGSAAGSLIFYLLGVTDVVDPIKYGLFFERFVSKSRAKKTIVDGVTYLDGSLMCDVDLDVDYARRHEVVEYINKKYPDRVSKILTLNTLTGKILIKECGKIIGEMPEQEMIEVVDLIPKKAGFVSDIEDANNEEKDEDFSPKFKEWSDANQDIYKVALKLRDLIKNKGSHASGFLICYNKLEEMMPLELTSDKDLVCSYDMKKAALVSVKLDVLGLRCCSVISEVVKLTGVDVNAVNVFDDPIIYDNLQNLQSPHGIFQIEADTNLQVCQAVKPTNLNELSDILAMARPGALAFLHDYVERKAKSAHPVFDPILAPTRNLCLYQEQMMQMAHAIGFTLDEAEILRRIVGKKEKEKVSEWQAKIDAKCKENGYSQEVGDLLWKILSASAKYSFNKSHSAAYAAMSALTTYLKFKYPQQFFLALLRMTRAEPNPIEEIMKITRELHIFGIRLLPPHLVKSGLDFELEGKDIRFGLLSIKGLSDKSIEKLNAFRSTYANKFEIFQAAQQAGLPLGILCALIQAGALSDENQQTRRSRLVLEAQTWGLLTDNEKRQVLLMGEEYGFDLLKIIITLHETKVAPKPKMNKKGQIVDRTEREKAELLKREEKGDDRKIKSKRFATIQRDYEKYKAIYLLNRQNEDFASWYYERELLGYSYSSSLVGIFRQQEPKLKSIERVREHEDGDKVLFVGVVSEIYQGVARNEKKTKYLKISMNDETASITALAFAWKIDQLKEQENMPSEGDIVVVEGKKKKDSSVFIDRLVRQNAKAYLKLSELKDIKAPKDSVKTE